MATLDMQAIRSELTVFLRNQDIISVAKRGVTTFTENLVATAGQTKFNLITPGVKNVRSVTVNSVLISFGTDYTVDYRSDFITLLVASTLSDTVDIVYDSGVGDKIYPDLPRLDLDQASYPRVGFDDISVSSTEQALNAELIESAILVSLIIYANQKDTVQEILKLARDAIIANKKSFFTISLITPSGSGPMGLSAGRGDKIVQKNQDFSIPFEFET